MIIPFLALSLQLYDLKELLDPLTLTLLFFSAPGIYHIFLTFSEIEFLLSTIFTNVTESGNVWLALRRMGSHLKLNQMELITSQRLSFFSSQALLA